MRHLSIRNKLTAVVSVFLTVALSAMAYFTFYFFETRYKDSITTQEFTLISALGNEIDVRIENAQAMLLANAEFFPVADVNDPEKMQAFLDSRTTLLSVFDNHLFIFSPEGKIIAESPGALERRGFDFSFRDYISATVTVGRPYISEPFLSSQEDRQPAIMFTVPIFDKNQRLVAIFAGSLNLLKENFLGTLAKTKIGQTGYVYLYNRNGTIIIHPQRDRILQQDGRLGSDQLSDKSIMGFEGAGELVSFKPLQTKDWLLAANHPLDELYAPVKQVRRYFLFISLVVLAITLVMIRTSLNVLIAPLSRFTQHVRTIPQKTGADRMSMVESNDEINDLSNAFNQMIHELDQQKLALIHSESKYRGVFEAAQDAIFIETLDGNIIDANSAASKLLQYSREELIGMNISRILPDTIQESPDERMLQILDEKIPLVSDNLRKDGSVVPIELTACQYQVADETYVAVITRDISDRKHLEQELLYLSQHDALTGLYDRAFFEEKIIRFSDKRYAPVGLVICDIDGLKLINDSLGHSAGDTLITKAAGLLKSCFRETDIVARIGGDEFAALLPNCSPTILKSSCQQINDAVFEYNLLHSVLPLSISIGYAIDNTDTGGDLNLLFREADDLMYREKLLNSQVARHSLSQSILREADAQNLRTGGHNERLRIFSEKLACRLQLSPNRIAILDQLARYHDIGKVCIADSTLLKPERLTPEEYSQIQRHPDIGRRIAQSIPELIDIAELIWKHHERWDGTGYPQGLKAEEIPLECRILSIIEAYDVMTNDRPFQPCISEEAAKAELRRCAGSQFDPHLVKKFLDMLDEMSESND